MNTSTIWQWIKWQFPNWFTNSLLVKTLCTARIWQRFLAISNWRYWNIYRWHLGRSIRVSSGSGVVMSFDVDILGIHVLLLVALFHLNHHVTLCFSFGKRVYAMFIDLIKKNTGFCRDVSCSPFSSYPVVNDENRLTIFKLMISRLTDWRNRSAYPLLRGWYGAMICALFHSVPWIV